jgi:hypothetical protein
LLDYPSQTPFAIIACYRFPSLILPYSVSSTLTLLTTKGGICNANDHNNNNAMNPPCLE